MRTYTQKQHQPQQRTFSNLTVSNMVSPAASHPALSFLQLQRTIGNQAVQRLLQATLDNPEACSSNSEVTTSAHDVSRGPARAQSPVNLQAKLSGSFPRDRYEEEADRVAEQVMHMPEPQLQRTCACGGDCPKCQPETLGQHHELLQAKRAQTSDLGQMVPPIVHEAISSPGQPLNLVTRILMEDRFGHDFSQVRVHTNGEAATAASAIQARAYTIGRDIMFGEAEYAPHSVGGQRLLAHELTHVLQQTGTVQRSPRPLERSPLSGLSPGLVVTRDHSGGIARQPQPAASLPAAPPTLAELNGWPMDSILSRLNELAQETLLALINEAKTVQGLNAPRLQLALDVVWTKKFSPIILPEFEAILPSRMEAIIPILENADQQKAIKNFLVRARPAKPQSSGALAAPLGAGEKPIPASQLKAFGTDEQTSFKRQVYEAHIAAAARVRKFSMGVAAADLVSIGGGHQLRKDAAPDMISLLAKVRGDLKTAQDAGDEQAQKVKSIGIGSSYRDTKQDFGLWDGYFEQYYEATRAKREQAEGGEHGPAAVSIMVNHYTNSKAAPGFSNHTSGIAVDFTTTEGTETLGASKSQNAKWYKSWLHKWLVENASQYNYEPLASEAFHWSHKMADPPPPERPHTDADAK